ncbi:MAG: hypothetical protein DMD74_06360 [Gemmatimonadetes bacterium]|nr:MAG: hypothetical protein DMD74_06360 [Gemmatimonadota bacterium]
MAELWGNERGPARASMKDSVVVMRVSAMRVYLNHVGYRIIEGPLQAPGQRDIVTFRVEMQREHCTYVQRFDVQRTRQGGWMVADVHIEQIPSPAKPCGGQTSGN